MYSLAVRAMSAVLSSVFRSPVWQGITLLSRKSRTAPVLIASTISGLNGSANLQVARIIPVPLRELTMPEVTVNRPDLNAHNSLPWFARRKGRMDPEPGTQTFRDCLIAGVPGGSSKPIRPYGMRDIFAASALLRRRRAHSAHAVDTTCGFEGVSVANGAVVSTRDSRSSSSQPFRTSNTRGN
jgi:hypothetical protein